MFEWSWEPSLLAGLAAQGGAYLACVGPLRRWFPGASPVPRYQIQLFLLGVVILFVALVSPLGVLSDGYLLSAHMIQHLLVTSVAPPLLLLGTPRWLFRPVLRVGLARGLVRALTHPALAVVLYNLVFVGWHVPAFYDRSLNSVPVHALQHVMFFSTATLLWWPIFSPLEEQPPLPDLLKVLYLFVASIPGTILGAIITYADTILYPTYGRAPRVWGISAALDQQAAGLIMWFGGGLLYLGVLTTFFFRYFKDDEFAHTSETGQVLQ